MARSLNTLVYNNMCSLLKQFTYACCEQVSIVSVLTSKVSSLNKYITEKMQRPEKECCR